MFIWVFLWLEFGVDVNVYEFGWIVIVVVVWVLDELEVGVDC